MRADGKVGNTPAIITEGRENFCRDGSQKPACLVTDHGVLLHDNNGSTYDTLACTVYEQA